MERHAEDTVEDGDQIEFKAEIDESNNTNVAEPPTSRLLSLPAELKNKIYEYVLTEEDTIEVHPELLKQPALLLTCRQIRKEALKIWYLSNKFVVFKSHHHDSCFRCIVTEHIQTMGGNVRHFPEPSFTLFDDSLYSFEAAVAGKAP